MPLPDEVSPVGGTLLAAVTNQYVGADIQGTLISRVWSGDTANFLLGYTFTYEIQADPASLHDISRLSVGNYGGFQTDVSYDSAGGGVAPDSATRSTGIGDVVRFNFVGIAPGQNSTLLVVQTSALSYDQSIVSVINAGSAEVISLAPTAIPEPTTFTLLGLGSLALMMVRRKI